MLFIGRILSRIFVLSQRNIQYPKTRRVQVLKVVSLPMETEDPTYENPTNPVPEPSIRF
jgi:hypothetical protein